MLLNWILNAATLCLVGYFIPGIHVAGFAAALIAVVVIGAINMVVRPIFVLLTLPITIVTLGLFLLFINSIMFYFAGSLFPSFRVDGAIPAILGSLVYSVVSAALSSRSRD